MTNSSGDEHAEAAVRRILARESFPATVEEEAIGLLEAGKPTEALRFLIKSNISRHRPDE